MNAQKVVSINQDAEFINERLKLGNETIKKGLKYYRDAGERLAKVRDSFKNRKKVKGEGFRAWIEQNLDCKRSEAYNYIKLYENWSRLSNQLDELNLSEALAIITDKQPTTKELEDKVAETATNDYKAQVEALQQQLEQQKAESQNQIADLTNRLTQAHNDSAELKESNAKLQEQLADLSQQLTQLSGQLSAKKKQIEEEKRKVIAAAKAEGQKERDRIIEKTKKEVTQITKHASSQGNLEKEKLEKDIKRLRQEYQEEIENLERLGEAHERKLENAGKYYQDNLINEFVNTYVANCHESIRYFTGLSYQTREYQAQAQYEHDRMPEFYFQELDATIEYLGAAAKRVESHQQNILTIKAVS